MKISFLGRYVLTVLLGLAFLNCSAMEPKAPEFATLDDGSHSVTVDARDIFTRNTYKLKAAALDAATQFCAKDGKVLRVTSAVEKKPDYVSGSFARAIVTFKAVAPGEVELAPAAENQNGALATTDAIYSQLIKLDDMRKKGILTDEEFVSEKKKLLALPR